MEILATFIPEFEDALQVELVVVFAVQFHDRASESFTVFGIALVIPLVAKDTSVLPEIAAVLSCCGGCRVDGEEAEESGKCASERGWCARVGVSIGCVGIKRYHGPSVEFGDTLRYPPWLCLI